MPKRRLEAFSPTGHKDTSEWAVISICRFEVEKSAKI